MARIYKTQGSGSQKPGSQKSGSQKKTKTNVDIKAISKKCFFDLSAYEQRTLRDSYRDFKHALVLNPYARAFIQKNTSDYISFIDARINSCYLIIKDFLEKNKEKISSYCCIGDADFIIEYSATEKIHRDLIKEIYDLMQSAPRENDADKLVEGYKILKVFRTRCIDNNFTEAQSYQISEDELQLLAQIQNDYTSQSAIDLFGSTNELKKFLHELKDNQILLGYCSLGEAKTQPTKSYVLLLYTKPGYENIIFRNKKLINNIVDFYSVDKDNIGDQFYGYAKYLVTAEFANINDYHEWKESLYKLSEEAKHQVNFMTFIWEQTISENPMGIGDYTLFDRVARSYNTDSGDQAFIGYPYFFNILKNQYKININMNTLKENGLIIGEPGTGKTYTAMVFAKTIYDQKRRIHIVDCTGGISEKFSEVYPEIKDNIIENVSLSAYDNRQFIFGQEDKIYFYQPEEEDYCKIAIKILKDIVKMKNPDESRKTSDIIIFEEAHLLFNDDRVRTAIQECIMISGRKGFSIWFSTQKLDAFPPRLLSNLRNRIIHRVDAVDKQRISELLLSNGKDTFYDDFEGELVTLDKGEAIVSFVAPSTSIDIELSPLKIKVTKKEEA